MKRLIRKASRILYHGTSSIYLDSIKENGIIPNSGNSNSKDSNSSFVYVTNQFKEAKDFADYTVEQKGGNPVVLHLNIDENLLLPDDNVLNYDIFDYDKTLELTEYTEEELKQWAGGSREENSKYYLPFEGHYGDDPILYTPDEDPFKGGGIFDILNLDLAKYPQAITTNEITKIEEF
ncbi:gp251 [Bacillus phage G]|uniref:Gp251 n=1 Tax=Bacillus phage G TaxID=2884420 RepID=G3M9Z2_9CAUD|nr:gp251 [Bacillus phage G]AEO93510.1 gp251 [Bacillus phage G]